MISETLFATLLLLGESSYLSISKSFSSTDKRNRLRSRLNAWRESLSLKNKLFEITILFQRLGPWYEMQYWLKFFWCRESWIEVSFWSAYLSFVLWVKILRNTEGLKICLYLCIKHRILKIFNLKTFKSFKSFNPGLARKTIFGTNYTSSMFLTTIKTFKFTFTGGGPGNMKNKWKI